jgi:hypothetical protein
MTSPAFKRRQAGAAHERPGRNDRFATENTEPGVRMNQTFVETCLILSRASAQIYARCAAHTAQTAQAAMQGRAPSWRESLDHTLALANDCMKESTSAFDAVWRLQRTSLELDAVSLMLRTLQGVEADRASAQNELHASFAADYTKQIADWLNAVGKARDSNDFMLGAAEYAQAWQDAVSRFNTGCAGLAARAVSATLEGLRSSVQKPAPDGTTAQPEGAG